MSIQQEIREFRENRKVLVRKDRWESWYNRTCVHAPMGFNVKAGITAYDIMRMSVASGFGYAWIPTPPDKTPTAWESTCKRFERSEFTNRN